MLYSYSFRSQFSVVGGILFTLRRPPGQWSRCTENRMSAFCEFQHHFVRDVIPSSLWAIEPGPINDHCPIPNLPANVFTILAFLKHSSLLSYLSQKMSLNIDINRILPVKVSGASRKSLSRSLTLPQSCNVVNPGEDVPLEFSRLSIDSIIISVALISCDPCNSVLPSFGGFWMLKDPPEAQHRIREDIDFCALKIDDCFITNQ